ncbi:MAG: hypothetical protein LIO65_02080 [Odoribacter sp.]|nr:hypothetical protein [Odoribacter sp.]
MKATYLFRTLLLFFCTATFISCVKEEDDSGTICESDCTVITGKVISSNNQSLSDIGIEVKYYEAQWLHHSLTRLKATAKTSNNGLFNMSFTLKMMS